MSVSCIVNIIDAVMQILITLHCPLRRKNKADHFQDVPKQANKVNQQKQPKLFQLLKQYFCYCYINNCIFELVERYFIFYVNFQTREE